jgi:hypothetical protein
LGSTITANLEEAKADYYAGLTWVHRVKWFKPLIVEGGEFSPLPPAWAAMIGWDSERARVTRMSESSETAPITARYWANRADEALSAGETWMPLALFNARLKGRDWSQFCSQPD